MLQLPFQSPRVAFKTFLGSRRALEIGCGSGYVSCSAARLLRSLGHNPRCFATDCSTAALFATKETFQNHEVRLYDLASGSAWPVWTICFYCCAKRLQAGDPLGQLRRTPIHCPFFPHLHAQLPTPELIRTDLCQGIVHGLRQQVDLLLFNPPYVPTPDEEMGLGDVLAAAWAGGWKGRRVVDRFLPLVPQLLSPQGQLFLIAVRENEPEGARHGPVLGCALSEEGLRGRWARMYAGENWPAARPETATTRRLPDF